MTILYYIADLGSTCTCGNIELSRGLSFTVLVHTSLWLVRWAACHVHLRSIVRFHHMVWVILWAVCLSVIYLIASKACLASSPF